MEKRKMAGPLLVAAALLVSGCNAEGNTSSGSLSPGTSEEEASSSESSVTSLPPDVTSSDGGSSSAPGEPEAEIEMGHTAQDVIDMTDELLKCNYRMSSYLYGYDVEPIVETWNGHYMSYGDSGYVALEDYDGEGTRVYNWTAEGGEALIGTGVTYTLSDGVTRYAEDMSQVNNFQLVHAEPGWSFNAGNIVDVGDGTFQTANYYARTAYAWSTAAGQYAYYNMIARLTFSFLEGGIFKVAVEGIDTSNDYVTIVTGYFEDIGTASDPAAEALFKGNYDLPATSAEGNGGALITSHDLTIESRWVRRSSLDLVNFAETLQGTSEVQYRDDAYAADIFDASGNLLARKQFEMGDGGLREIGLGLDNAAHEKEATYENGELPRLYEAIDPKAFRSEDGTTFSYFGNEYDAIISSLFPTTFNQEIKEIKAVAHGGVVDEIVITFVTYTNGTTYFYDEIQAKLTSGSHIAEPAPMDMGTALPEVTAALKAFDPTKPYSVRFEQANSPYIITSQGDHVDFTYDPIRRAVMIETFRGGALVSREGYAELTAGELTPFREVDGELIATATPSEGSIEQFAISLNPAAFAESTAVGDYALKEGITSLEGGGFLGGDGLQDLYLTNSFRLETEGEGSAAKLLDFYYMYTDPVEGTRYVVAQPDFTSSGISANYDIEGIAPYEVPSTWAEESSSIAKTIKALFGDAEVPYLYDEALNGQWKGRAAGGALTLYSNAESEGYLARYADLLLEKGYALDEDGNYSNGVLVITVGATLKEGIVVRKA